MKHLLGVNKVHKCTFFLSMFTISDELYVSAPININP